MKPVVLKGRRGERESFEDVGKYLDRRRARAKGAAAWILDSWLVQPLAGIRIPKVAEPLKDVGQFDSEDITKTKVKNLQNSAVRLLTFSAR